MAVKLVPAERVGIAVVSRGCHGVSDARWGFFCEMPLYIYLVALGRQGERVAGIQPHSLAACALCYGLAVEPQAIFAGIEPRYCYGVFIIRRINIGITGIYGFLYGGICLVDPCPCLPLNGRMGLMAGGNGWLGEPLQVDSCRLLYINECEKVLRFGRFSLSLQNECGARRAF